MATGKQIHIIGGGTVFHVASHLALSAPAYGTTAKELGPLCYQWFGEKMSVNVHLTKMAGGSELETNEDIARLLMDLGGRDSTKIIFMCAAMCDYRGYAYDKEGARLSGPGKYATRMNSTKNSEIDLRLFAEDKVIKGIRQVRKDIFLVGFKTTCGATEDEQYLAGLKLCKDASVNLVLANDTQTRTNMVVTPEEARYYVTKDRAEALSGLVKMTYMRSQLTFTRSTVVAGDPIPWNSPMVPAALRTVVNHCIVMNAYKPFQGKTAGHFACKIEDNTFLTSIRKSDFNKLNEIGLVKIVTDGPDTVLAYGAKPSVGGQSQRIVFRDHPEYDCIVHFHCPIRPGSNVPVISQEEYECGSHECGQNTSKGLYKFGSLSAVYLKEHGPNVVFHKSINPQEVIDFIEENFDLTQKTGGYVSASN